MDHKNSMFNFNSSAMRGALAIVATLTASIISSCGGAGTSSTSPAAVVVVPTVTLAVLPGTADIFPQVPTIFTVTGGKAGFTLFTSNAVVLPVTQTINGTTFSVTANTVAADTAVTLTIRDAEATQTTVTVNVKAAVINNQVTFTPIAPTGTGCGGLCSGGDAQVQVNAVLNGLALTNRSIRFSVFQGNFQFVTPVTGVLASSITINTDERGIAIANLRAAVAAVTQAATLATTDVTSGLIRYTNFNIIQQNTGTGIISTLPSGAVTFTGSQGPAGSTIGNCPIGATVDYYVYGGSPPYTINTAFPQLFSPFPSVVTASGASFRVTVLGCGFGTLFITDSLQRNVETSLITSTAGPAGTAIVVTPPTIAVAPAAVTLACGQTASVNVSGFGSFTTTVVSAFPTQPTTVPATPVAFTVSPSAGAIPGTVSFTRNNGNTLAGGGPTLAPASVTVNIINGSLAPVPVTVTVPVSCP